MRELPKVYEPQQYEDAIYKKWEESGLFNPDVCVEKGVTTSDAEPFSIVLPPPNVTGTLHMGHAAMLAIEDVMVRYHRMKGDKTLWVPGTDHAAIATQSKVEKMILEKEGKTKYDLGREEFLKRVEEFAQESHDTIVNQCKKMGASLDWSREAYTLDEKRNLAVRTVFKKMYEDGLIYRGYRVINWSVKGQSTISDDEIIYVERPAKLYYFKYSKDFPITIATTRPETKLGDTAVAVNPKDKRYKKYIGKEFTVDLGTDAPLKIKIIADDSVDANFGTGALGVTPAHSAVDFEIYQKQKAAGNDIGLIQVIGEDGKMTLMAGMYAYAGLPVLEAREKFVNYLRENDLLEKEEDITQNVGTSDRFGDIIEPLPKTQWFVDVSKKIKDRGNKTLKQLMQEAVRDKKIEIVPDRFEKTYFHWIDNLRDWCISRQLWYGHQIPSYYNITDPKNHTAFLYYKGGIIATDQIQNKLSEIASQFLTTGERQKKLHEFVWFSNSDRSVCGLTFRMAYELVKSGIVGWQDLKYYSAIDTQCVATAESYIDRPAEEFYFQDLDTLDTWFSSGLWTFSTLGWPTTEFTVMRHGEAEHNIQAILDTTNEGKFSLTSKGRKQVEAAAKKLKSSGIELIIASPFTRTQETAEIVAKTLGVEIITDDRLREVGGNDMHGKPVGDYMNMRKAPGGWDGTNGLESFTELKSRVTEFFKDTLQKYPNKKILIVSHGDPIRVMRSHTTADLYTEKLLLDPAGVATVSIASDGTLADLSVFHPTSVMETGYDILFFWVARMILMTTYTLGEVPFKTVYLHGLVRDEQGRKMSKSLGNIINPLDMIAKYGTDATRLSLLLGNTPGNDMKLSEEKIAGFRNFTNKLWNISRFMLLNIDEPKVEIKELKAKTLADEWVLFRLNKAVKFVTENIEDYNFSLVGDFLREFTWDNIADWYLEIAKVEGGKSEILNLILNTILKLWHPFMPFVTESIWEEIYGKDKILMVEKWPEFVEISEKKAKELNIFYDVIKFPVTHIRSLRAEYKIEPAKKIIAKINVGKNERLVKENEEIIKALARLEKLEFVESGAEVSLDLAGAIDAAKEKPRLEKEIAEIKKYLSGLENKLANKEFVQNAPKAVVEKEKEKLTEAKSKLEKFVEQLENLK